MNMFARFDEIPTMTVQDIKESKRYGRMHGQGGNSILPTNTVCWGIIILSYLKAWVLQKL